MTTLYATYRVPGDGVTTQFEFSFSGGYMDKAHVKAYIEDAVTLARDPVEVLPSMFVGDFTIDLGVAAPVGSNMVIYRDTPKSGPLVDFVTGSRLTEANLDKVAQQSVFIGAEISDATNADVLTAATAAAQAVLDAAEAAAASAAAASASEVAADASEAAALASEGAAAASAVTSDAKATASTEQAVISTAQAVISTTKASEAAASAAAALGSSNTSTAQAVVSTAQAVIATTQANVATTQAGISTAQATASASSAADAAASAAAAAASFDNFDDRYLGAKATPPSVDNDGNPLVKGALYYNTGAVVNDDKGMWVWDEFQWLKASAAAQAIMVTYRFVVPAGTSTISGNDADGKPLSYTPGSLLVDANGALIYPPDYTATTGTSITLTEATTQPTEEIIVFAYSTFNVANTYTKAEVDTSLATKVPKTTVNLATWTLEEVAGVLYFKVAGVSKGKLDASGNLTVTGNVTGFGVM